MVTGNVSWLVTILFGVTTVTRTDGILLKISDCTGKASWKSPVFVTVCFPVFVCIFPVSVSGNFAPVCVVFVAPEAVFPDCVWLLPEAVFPDCVVDPVWITACFNERSPISEFRIIAQLYVFPYLYKRIHKKELVFCDFSCFVVAYLYEK